MKIMHPLTIIRNIFYGFMMGSAEVVPGVSGTAISLMLGFYHKVVDTMFNITEVLRVGVAFLIRKATFKELWDQVFKFDFLFLIPLVIGVLLSGILLPSLVLYLFENYPAYLYAFLFGLAISVTVVPLKAVNLKDPKQVFIAVVAFLIAFYILGISPATSGSSDRPGYLMLFFGGIAGISGMILPAVSGGFILIILGLYYYIVEAIRDIVHLKVTVEQIVDLTVFTTGVGIGFLTFSRILKHFFDNKKDILMSLLLGLIIASYRVVWPFVEKSDGKGEFAVEQVGITQFETKDIVIIVTIALVTAILLTFLTLKHTPEEELV